MLEVQISRRCCFILKVLFCNESDCNKRGSVVLNYMEWSTTTATFRHWIPTGPPKLAIQSIFMYLTACIRLYCLHILHQSLSSFYEVLTTSFLYQPLSVYVGVIGLSCLLLVGGCFSMIQLCVEHLTITEQKHDRWAQQGTTACCNGMNK